MWESIEKRLSKISKLQREIQEIRDKCQHTRVTYKYGANTGDPYSTDRYWSDVTCVDCCKQMRFDSEDDSTDYRLVGVIGSLRKERIY